MGSPLHIYRHHTVDRHNKLTTRTVGGGCSSTPTPTPVTPDSFIPDHSAIARNRRLQVKENCVYPNFTAISRNMINQEE